MITRNFDSMTGMGMRETVVGLVRIEKIIVMAMFSSFVRILVAPAGNSSKQDYSRDGCVDFLLSPTKYLQPCKFNSIY